MNKILVLLVGLGLWCGVAVAADEPVTVILSFGGPGDADAGDLERALRFGAEHAATPFAVDIVYAVSAFDAATLAARAMQAEATRLVVCAGDEGSSVAISLLSKQYQTPTLKITSEPRSFTSLSSWLYEFLPSLEAQGEALGEFVVKERGCRYACALGSDDDRGYALASGFQAGVERAKAVFDGAQHYLTGAPRILPELNELYKLQRERAAVGDAALSGDERAELFGDSAEGEVLATTDEAAGADSPADDALFFGLTSDRIDSYAAQLKKLSKRTVLCGNAGWINQVALERNQRITTNMLIAAPMLPVPRDTTELLVAYLDLTGVPPGEWELLGLDAAEYVSRVLAAQPVNRPDVIRVMNELDSFSGSAVSVDFRYGHENRSVRILEFVHGELTVIR